MESVKFLLYLVICHSAGIITAADYQLGQSAQNVRWTSLDFKTLVTWESQGPDQRFTVKYSTVDAQEWLDTLDCTDVSHTECDMSHYLRHADQTYLVDILTEDESAYDDPEALPHAYSPHFNPYKQSNISAAPFNVTALDDGRVIVNITDPLTNLHDPNGRQLNIRDVFRNDLKYKISYNKEGNTRSKDYDSDSSVAEVPKLDAGVSYCFTVAAYIPSRARENQLGVVSQQPKCTAVHTDGLTLGALVGIVFILLTVLIVIIIVTVLCCKCCPKRKSLHTSQTSSPI